MADSGLRPSSVTHDAIIEGLVRTGNWPLGCLKSGKAMAPRLNIVLYSRVIDGLFKEGRVDKACGLYNSMMRKGIRLGIFTYTTTLWFMDCALRDGGERLLLYVSR
ncbi:hypothetical protein CDL15_Pgr022284 [Punica granatum]|uniref:Pentatricopeptide repeat-containing protein n=1 Tax=Punica granatum TaxID=22663 RepID=A0A218WN25_PUNGR|nr:hypothetical protein CDL15_Pgr022284 [Punica granatum]